MRDDAELLRRYVFDRSQEAFAELVQQHLGLVYQAALWHLDGDFHGSRDVAQTVFVDLARKAGSLVQRPLVASWLHTSTRYAALKYRRDEKLRHLREQAAGHMEELTNKPEPKVEWDSLRPVIDEALQALKPDEREAVLLRFFEGRDYGELGARLQLSQHTVRSRVERALGKMQSRLARRGIVSTVAALTATLTSHAAAPAPAGFAATVSKTAFDAGAGASGSSALSLGILGLMKASSLILAGSLVANAIIGGLYFGEARAAPARLAIARPPAPASVVIPDFPPPTTMLTDPVAIARKLRAFGFSERIVHRSVFFSVDLEYKEETNRRNAQYAARRARWNPRPQQSAEVTPGLEPVRRSYPWDASNARRGAVMVELGFDPILINYTPLAAQYRNLSQPKIAIVQKIEKDYEEIRRMAAGPGEAITAAVSHKLAEGFEADLRAALSPAEVLDYQRYNSEVGKKVVSVLAPLKVNEGVHAMIADAELEAERLNRATASDRKQRGARQVEVLKVYRRELGDDRFLQIAGKLSGLGDRFTGVDALYREAGLSPARRTNLYFTMTEIMIELSTTAPVDRPALTVKARTALTTDAGLAPEKAAAFDARASAKF